MAEHTNAASDWEQAPMSNDPSIHKQWDIVDVFDWRWNSCSLIWILFCILTLWIEFWKVIIFNVNVFCVCWAVSTSPAESQLSCYDQVGKSSNVIDHLERPSALVKWSYEMADCRKNMGAANKDSAEVYCPVATRKIDPIVVVFTRIFTKFGFVFSVDCAC